MRISPKSVAEWVTDARPNDKFIYHIGKALPARPTKSIKEIRRLYNDGEICLVQRRIAPAPDGEFEYIAVRRRYRSRPKRAMSKDEYPQPVHLFSVAD